MVTAENSGELHAATAVNNITGPTKAVMNKRAAAAAASEKEDTSLKIDPESLDPLDPRRVSLDIFEVYCHEMLNSEEVGRRAFLIKKMRYMIHRLIGTQYEYGRLYNYSTLANIIARVCGRYAYHGDGDEGDEIQLTDYLIDFDLPRWEKVINQLDRVRDSLIRKDASFTLLPTEIVDVPGADADNEEVIPSWIPEANDEINEEMESSEAFSELFLEMRDWIKFHACLSCVQPQFQNALKNGTDVISMENIAKLDHAIKNLYDDEASEYVGVLRSLFNESKSARTKKSKTELSLKPFKEIKAIYEDNANIFDLRRLQIKLIKLARRWVESALPVPNLAKLGYGSKARKKDDGKSHGTEKEIDVQSESVSSSESSNKNMKRSSKGKSKSEVDKFFDDSSESEAGGEHESATQSKMEDLRLKREVLGKKVKDPLEKSVAQAASLNVMNKFYENRGHLYQEKKSARTLEFTDSENESSENEGADLTMSEVPSRLKRSEDSKPAAINIQLPGQRSGPTKRKRFTEEEDEAIIKGVKRFGVGKWTEIKSSYPMELKDRGTVQIKDRYRTLTKSAE